MAPRPSRTRLALAALLLLLVAPDALAGYPSCAPGLTCGKLAPHGPSMVYDCAYARPPSASSAVLGNVYLMHGDDGFQAKAMWAETMLQLADKGYASLACDQRGYSPGASPNDPKAYHYDLLAEDVLALTSAAGFNGTAFGGKFHVVAHDQGARIAWHSIAKNMTRDKILSLSSLSIPHADVFSDNVYGQSANTADQTAEQYLRQLTLNNSVNVNHATIFSSFCKQLGFDTPKKCQPSFWWYNGAVDAGNMAMAPLMPFKSSIASKVNIPYEMVEKLTPYPLSGVPQTARVGVVRAFPVFFACGSQDTCDLCEDRVVQQTKARVASTFTSVINGCGHKLISPEKCADKGERQKVIDGIIANIVSATAAVAAAPAAAGVHGSIG